MCTCIFVELYSCGVEFWICEVVDWYMCVLVELCSAIVVKLCSYAFWIYVYLWSCVVVELLCYAVVFVYSLMRVVVDM